MTKHVSLEEAEANLEELLEEANGGAEIVILVNDAPRAWLIPLSAADRAFLDSAPGQED